MKVQRIAVPDFCQRVQDQPRRDALGNRAGQRHTRDIELADDDEEQVQHNIQRTCDRKIGQWLLGIADGAEHSVAEVIERQRGHTQKVDAQVQDGTGEQVLFGIQQPQQRGRADQTDKQQQHTRRQADQQRRMDGLADVLGVPGTVKPRHQHIDTVAEADKKAGEQCDERCRGADCAQRRGACKAAHNGNIGQVEQNL